MHPTYLVVVVPKKGIAHSVNILELFLLHKAGHQRGIKHQMTKSTRHGKTELIPFELEEYYCDTSAGSFEFVLTAYPLYQHPDHCCLLLSFFISTLSL